MNFFIGKHKFLEMFDSFFVNLKKHYNKDSKQKLRNFIAEHPDSMWSLMLSKIVICKDKGDIGLVHEDNKHHISLFHRNDHLHLKIKSNNEEEKEKKLPANNHNFTILLKEIYDFIKHIKYKK